MALSVFGPGLPVLGAIGAPLTTCPGPCTITQIGLPVPWGYLGTTISDANGLEALSSSLSSSRAAASATDSRFADFTIQTDIPPPSTIQTAPDGYTTITCCDDHIASIFILSAEGTTCGVQHTQGFAGTADPVQQQLSTWNDFYATLVTDHNESPTIGGNMCETTTVTFEFDVLPPHTKTYIPFLVVQRQQEAPPAVAAPQAPSLPESTGEAQAQQRGNTSAPALPESTGEAQAQQGENTLAPSEQEPPRGPTQTPAPAPVAGSTPAPTPQPTNAENPEQPLAPGQGSETPATGQGSAEQTSVGNGAPVPPESSGPNTFVPAESTGRRLLTSNCEAMLWALVALILILGVLM